MNNALEIDTEIVVPPYEGCRVKKNNSLGVVNLSYFEDEDCLYIESLLFPKKELILIRRDVLPTVNAKNWIPYPVVETLKTNLKLIPKFWDGVAIDKKKILFLPILLGSFHSAQSSKPSMIH